VGVILDDKEDHREKGKVDVHEDARKMK